MVILYQEHNKNDPLLRIVKKQDKKLWNIFFENHNEIGKEFTYNVHDAHKLTAEIIMNAKDLKRFAKEIRRMINVKPVEEERLRLTFRDNKPQFVVLAQFMQREGQVSYREKVKGKVYFAPLFNARYAVLHHSRPEDQYIYENGGGHTGSIRYYDPDELLKFADDLEKEADSATNLITTSFSIKGFLEACFGVTLYGGYGRMMM